MVLYAGVTWAVLRLFTLARARWSGVQTTSLRGPPSKSILFGKYHEINQFEDSSILYEQWANEYGQAYKVPGGFGAYRILIMDPRAIAHYYAKESFVYVQNKFAKMFIANLFGRGLLWAEGESHRRQRKALSPAFSNTAIRRLTSVFYDSSYKMKARWDYILDSVHGNDAVIDVEKWMNHVSLDAIGIAGFGHDFGTLDGKYPAIVEVFDALGSSHSIGIFAPLLQLITPILPWLMKLPTRRNKLMAKLRQAMSDIADELLARTRKEKEGRISEEKSEEKSIIGLLIKAESLNTELQMSREEITAQMNLLLLAGYETTSISLTWALIELSRNVEKQQKLRDELSQFSGTDPTWEQLATGLPYLDSVVHETLRLHPAVPATLRIATEDDIIPLSSPVITSDGEAVTSIAIKKGTTVISPIRAMNRSEAFWGPNAKEFEPERWLVDSDIPAKEISGHRHLLTFSDGPRLCLGRGFALAEFKATLSVLIRNYSFELPEGIMTKIENHQSVLSRPKVAGQDGAKVPLKVKRVD